MAAKSFLSIVGLWLILGPTLGVVVSLITGEARGEEIILSTIGGLIGISFCAVVDAPHSDTALNMLGMLVGALTLMLLYDALMGLSELDV
jgi:hypothetical protein